MSPEVFSAVGTAAVTVAVGVYITLRGFRVVGKKPGESPSYDAWCKRNGAGAKVVGLIIVLYGVLQGVTSLMRTVDTVDHPLDWKRYATADGVFSAEFAAPPDRETDSSLGIEYVAHSLDKRDTAYLLTVSTLPPDASEATAEERLDAMLGDIREIAEAKGETLVRKQKLRQDGVSGREFEKTTEKRYVTRGRVFLIGNLIYKALAVTPPEYKDDKNTNRFLDSIRFETNRKGEK